MAEEITKLKAKRTVVRGNITKFCNKIENSLKNTEIDLQDLEESLEQLIKKADELKLIDRDIEDFLKPEDFQKEFESVEDYSEKIIKWSYRAKKKINELNPIPTPVSASPVSTIDSNSQPVQNFTEKLHLRLPKLSIPRFFGDISQWLNFWNCFESAIHNNDALNKIDKFNYLKAHLGSVAADTIEGFSISEENYDKCIEILKERFARKDLLINAHLNNLLNIPPLKNANDLPRFRHIVDKCKTQIRSLESLDIVTDTYGSILRQILLKLLPEDLILAISKLEDTESNINTLIDFLTKELAAREKAKFISSHKTSDNYTLPHNSSTREKDKTKFNKNYSYSKQHTAAGLYTSKILSCLFCEKPHESKDCVLARSLSLEEKRNKVKDKNCCLKCLRFGHRAKVCRVFVRCHFCSKAHTELFCPDMNKGLENSNRDKTPELVQNTHAHQQCLSEVALMTLNVVIKGNKKSKRVRALLDSGSQKSYILKSTAEELNLKPLGTEIIAHSVFGGAQIDPKPHNRFKVNVSAVGSNHRNSVHVIDFLGHEKICGKIPRIPKELISKELKKNRLWISDIGPDCPEIEILIGSDFYGQILTGRVKQLENGFTAIQTKLGWTLCGQSGVSSQGYVNSGTAVLMTNLFLNEFNIPDLWRLETLGINDPAQTLSRKEEEEMAHDMFLKQLSRNEEGRYCVGLPWTCNNSNIPSNRNEAERRLFSTTRRLKKLKKFEDYDSVFKEWQKEGVIEEVSKKEIAKEKCHYLCHHPVLKPGSTTTSIRPVFDASCKVGRAPSLNDCLFKGPNLTEEIPAILLRFREKAIAVVSDIRRAFLQIEIKKEDRHFLRFLWWENPNEIKVYQHNRVVFGVTSSPFLLSAVIRYHLNQYPENLKTIAQKLLKSFYVDNCVTSVDTPSELEEFIIRSTKIMSEAKMDLRMWEFGPTEKVKNLLKKNILPSQDVTTIVPVLGLEWDRNNDCLNISYKNSLKLENPSKRQILAITQSIYDPIGFSAPALLPAKLMIQEAWSTKSDWDVPLPEKIQKKFCKWHSELKCLTELKFDRRIGFGGKENWSVHTFCDASQNAYATVVYLRCMDVEEVYVRLLGAKSRLAPKKNVTIPRLELLACVLGTRLTTYIQQALDIVTVPVQYWTDSSTALAWIRRNDQWGTFVGNRVREICKSTESRMWNFVPGPLNPADLPSRGCSPEELVKTRWWEGPRWLKLPREKWPHTENTPDEELVKREKRKNPTVTLACSKPHEFMRYDKISKFNRLINVLCWMRRFLMKTRKKIQSFPPELSVEEKKEAENILWLRIQLESFGEVTNSFKGLSVVKDDKGLLRVRTKLLDREDEFSFKYPILLPSKHHVVNCLIQECHIKNCHAGLQTVGSILREKYWIISAKRNIRSQISKCVRCKIFSSKPPIAPPIQLPFDRVRDSKVFEVVGIDLCGPLFLKNKSKVWIVLFTCAVYRAIHLELVTNLSTEGFIQALRRFISRRGRPSTIYSDNGTNFRGTNNLLKSLNWNEVTSSKELFPIKWKFIPPTAAWWGGWWERLIRSVKNLLLRTLGRTSLKFEDLSTILCEVEATLNNRPLTYIAEESDKFIPLTPSSFIQDIQEIGVPDLDKISSQKLRKRYRICQNIKEQLRNRFRKEYLATLVQKSKEKSQTIQTNDVVLVELNNKKRLEWPLGRVIKIFPSRDGSARVAEVKTSSGIFVRPIRRLYPLEISNRDDPVIQRLNCTTVRCTELSK